MELRGPIGKVGPIISIGLLSGCTTPTVLAAGTTAYTIALTTTDVYWDMNAGAEGRLVHCTKSGCGGNPTVAGTSQAIGGAFLIDQNNAYWGTAAGVVGDIVRCTGLSCKSGADVIAENQTPASLVADKTSLYWSDLNKGAIYMLSPK